MGFEYPEGATPLDPDEVEGLRLTHITTREQLNIFEAENIREGIAWARRSRRKDMLDEVFISQLHRRMFGRVWKWAGAFRKTDKNIGVPKERIGIELRKLCDDVKYWIDHGSFEADEIAVRFHHRLVSIHPFASGNGRHARVMSDLLLEKRLDRPPFSWGGASLVEEGNIRSGYIQALRAADRGDYSLLFAFVRT